MSLIEVKRQFEDASRQARAVVEGLSEEEMTHRPQPGRWSVAECLVHLSLTSRAYLPILSSALDGARQQRLFGDGRFKMDIKGRLLKWIIEPPPKFRVRAPENFQPLEVGSPQEVLPTFLALQEQLEASVEQSAGLALDKVKITSPFDRRVRYNLLSCFNLLAAHERRHLWQAEQVRKSLGGA